MDDDLRALLEDGIFKLDLLKEVDDRVWKSLCKWVCQTQGQDHS